MLTVVIALTANTVLAVLKTIVAAVTGSASMVAEAAHSWADAGNEVFLVDRRAPLGEGGRPHCTRSVTAARPTSGR